MGGVGRGDSKEGVSNLFDLDGAREGSLLRVVTFKLEEFRDKRETGRLRRAEGVSYLDAVFFVFDAVGCDRWVVAA